MEPEPRPGSPVVEVRAAGPADTEVVASIYVASRNHGFGSSMRHRELSDGEVVR